jgi:hypothetical protein
MFVQIKTLYPKHNCPTTKLQEGKMASQGWCADRIKGLGEEESK